MLEDCRSGLRQIRRNPGFVAAIVLTLALGVGATTAVFTLADPMLFRRLPYPDAERVVTIHAVGDPSVASMLLVPQYLRLEANRTAFEAVGGFGPLALGRLRGHDETIIGYGVTPEFLNTLGIRPIRGRGFLRHAHRPGDYPVSVVLITYGLWQSHYGGREDVLGRTLELHGPAGPCGRWAGHRPRHWGGSFVDANACFTSLRSSEQRPSHVSDICCFLIRACDNRKPFTCLASLTT